jgi:hypothetical protein
MSAPETAPDAVPVTTGSSNAMETAPEPLRLSIALALNGEAGIQDGDRLVVDLIGRDPEGVIRRKTLAFDLAAGDVLPPQVAAEIAGELAPAAGEPPLTYRLRARLADRSGNIFAFAAPVVVQVGHAAVQTRVVLNARGNGRAPGLSLTPDQIERYDRPTAARYKELCASGQTGDEGFCGGVMFALLPEEGTTGTDFCPPTNAFGEWDTRTIVEQGRQVIARLPAGNGDALQLARTALRTAFPCPAESRAIPAGLTSSPVPAANGAPLRVTSERDGQRIAFKPGQKLIVQLITENGTPVVSGQTDGTVGDDDPTIDMEIPDRYFPGIGQRTRVYTLTGVLYGADGSVINRAEPVTLRLAPGSRLLANLRPTLTFPA